MSHFYLIAGYLLCMSDWPGVKITTQVAYFQQNDAQRHWQVYGFQIVPILKFEHSYDIRICACIFLLLLLLVYHTDKHTTIYFSKNHLWWGTLPLSSLCVPFPSAVLVLAASLLTCDPVTHPLINFPPRLHRLFRFLPGPVWTVKGGKAEISGHKGHLSPRQLYRL